MILCFILFCSLILKGQESYIKDPKKAALYSAIIPGAGQAYTNKYWKIPFIYAGLITSAYYINESYTQYTTYKGTYIDRIEGNNTDQYIGVYTDANLITLTEHYRRNTEISVLLFSLTYILNIVDASVNAHLFEYNITNDISMRIHPISHQKGNINGIHLCFNL